MKLKQTVLSLTPPILYTFLDELLNPNRHKQYGSYQEARKESSKDAYEDRQLVEVVRYKMERYLDAVKLGKKVEMNATRAYTALAITRLMAKYPSQTEFTILDFGGGVGGHYFDTKMVVGDKIKLKWAVVETPAMAAEGQKLATEELHFFDDLAKAQAFLGSVNLLHTSGTLQCVDNPYQFLDLLLNVGAEMMLFNRLGLNRKNRDYITVHRSKLSWNGFEGLPEGVEDRIISYPFTFMSEKTFFDHISKSYNVVLQFEENSGKFPVKGEDIVGLGLLVERK